MTGPLTTHAGTEFRRERDAAEDTHGGIAPVATPPSVYVPAYARGLKVLDAEQLLAASFPPRTSCSPPGCPTRASR